MRTILANAIACVLLFVSLCPVTSAGVDEPLGVVLQAKLAHVRDIALTEGSSVYPGEDLSTEISGSLELRILKSRFSLAANSRAHFYSGEKGTVAELIDGALAFRGEPGGGVEIMASDVRIVTKGDGPAAGQVTIESPCMITVTSLAGELEVTSGSETRIVAEKETYSVTPDMAVAAVRTAVSPEDPTYHASHTHMACNLKDQPKQASRFRKIAPALVLAGAGALLAAKFLGGSQASAESPTQP